MLAAVPPESMSAVLAAAGEGARNVELRAVPQAGETDLERELAGVEFLVVDLGRDDVISRLASLPRLDVVQVLLAGTDWIASSIPAGVTLCDASGTRNIPTAEWALAALIGVTSGLLRAVRHQGDAHWEHFRRDELAGKVVVIIGQGSIGTALRTRLEALGVEVLGVARRPRRGAFTVDALPELLPRADAVVLLTPLTQETRGMVDAAFLGRLPDGALVVNAARGPVVNTDALVAELQSGRLGAVLDVVDPEPLPPSHPLWSLPNTYLSPRIGGDTAQGELRAWRFAGEQLARHARKEPLLNVAIPGTNDPS